MRGRRHRAVAPASHAGCAWYWSVVRRSRWSEGSGTWCRQVASLPPYRTVKLHVSLEKSPAPSCPASVSVPSVLSPISISLQPRFLMYFFSIVLAIDVVLLRRACATNFSPSSRSPHAMEIVGRSVLPTGPRGITWWTGQGAHCACCGQHGSTGIRADSNQISITDGIRDSGCLSPSLAFWNGTSGSSRRPVVRVTDRASAWEHRALRRVALRPQRDRTGEAGGIVVSLAHGDHDLSMCMALSHIVDCIGSFAQRI